MFFCGNELTSASFPTDPHHRLFCSVLHAHYLASAYCIMGRRAVKGTCQLLCAFATHWWGRAEADAMASKAKRERACIDIRRALFTSTGSCVCACCWTASKQGRYGIEQKEEKKKSQTYRQTSKTKHYERTCVLARGRPVDTWLCPEATRAASSCTQTSTDEHSPCMFPIRPWLD